MRHNDTTNHATLHLTQMSALRGITLPEHLSTTLASAPSVYVIDPHRHTIENGFVEPDFEQLFPPTHTFDPPAVECGEVGCAGDVCGLWWCGTGDYATYAAMLTYYSAGVLYDRFLSALRVDGCDLLNHEDLSLGRNHHLFDLVDLEELLPITVFSGLYLHSNDDSAAWVAMLLAEIQLHAASIATGRFMTPHSPISALALHLILDDLQLELAELDGQFPLHPDLAPIDSETPVLMLREALLDGEDLGCFALRLRRLGMGEWLTTFPHMKNPWLSCDAYLMDDTAVLMSTDELAARIATAPSLATYLTAPAVRVEFESWLERYLGAGRIGRITPELSFDPSGNCAGVSHATCTAEVLGIPLGSGQSLELRREAVPGGFSLAAFLVVSRAEAERVPVRCLADLAGWVC